MPSLLLTPMFMFLWPYLLILQKIFVQAENKGSGYLFGVLNVQKTRTCPLSTFTSVVLYLQLICICIITQCKGHMWWRIHMYLFVKEKCQLCWGYFRFVTVMTLEQFWGTVLRVWTISPRYLFCWPHIGEQEIPAECVSVDTHAGRYIFPQLAELWDWLPSLPFLDLFCSPLNEIRSVLC